MVSSSPLIYAFTTESVAISFIEEVMPYILSLKVVMDYINICDHARLQFCAYDK